MDAPALARVRFLVRSDAWEAWEALPPSPDALDMALSEYGDLRLVAAYVLETVCSAAKLRDADAAVQHTKRIKVGPIELEKATGGAGALATSAALWCARAAELRGQVDASMRQSRGLRSISLPVEVCP